MKKNFCNLKRKGEIDAFLIFIVIMFLFISSVTFCWAALGKKEINTPESELTKRVPDFLNTYKYSDRFGVSKVLVSKKREYGDIETLYVIKDKYYDKEYLVVKEAGIIEIKTSESCKIEKQ